MHRFRDPEDRLLIARDVFVIAFFTEQPFPSTVSRVEEVFDRWLSFVPEDRLEWACVGPNSTRYKAFTPSARKGCRAELDENKGAEKGRAYFTVRGGEDVHNPSYAFTFRGSMPLGKVPDRTSLVEIRWPSEFPDEFGADKFVDWVRHLGDLLPYRSGYASPALSRGWEDSAHVQEGGRHIVPLAFRHPGYDLPENEATASFMPKNRCRGARWLTLLGPSLVEGLGGREALDARLDPGVMLHQAGTGLLLRAGDRPEVGDVNRGEVPLLLRSVAAAIEPVTYFEDWRSLGDLFDDDEDKLLRWERRHLD